MCSDFWVMNVFLFCVMFFGQQKVHFQLKQLWSLASYNSGREKISFTNVPTIGKTWIFPAQYKYNLDWSFFSQKKALHFE